MGIDNYSTVIKKLHVMHVSLLYKQGYKRTDFSGTNIPFL